MYYKRRPTRRYRTRKVRRPRKATAPRRKRLINLIKSVSLSTQETKIFRTNYNLYGALAPVGSSYSVCLPIFGPIPKLKNTATLTDGSVIGNQFWSRGAKFKFLWTSVDTAAANAPYQRMRISLISTSNIMDATSTGLGVVFTPASWYEFSTMPTTVKSFETQRIRVLKSRTYTLAPRGGLVHQAIVNFWCPIKGRKTSKDIENTINQSYIGILDGKNYYIVVEVWNVSGQALDAKGTITVDGKVYFKDA